jgi:hypothetical protein
MNNTIFGDFFFFFSPQKNFSHNNFNITIYCISFIFRWFFIYFRDVLDIYLFHLSHNVMPETKKKIIRKLRKIYSKGYVFVPIWLNVIPETKEKNYWNLKFFFFLTYLFL